jgi:signal transduction histidine kinase
MTKPAESDKPEPKRTRLEEARRIIEEYANDLREIIRKLREKLN